MLWDIDTASEKFLIIDRTITSLQYTCYMCVNIKQSKMNVDAVMFLDIKSSTDGLCWYS